MSVLDTLLESSRQRCAQLQQGLGDLEAAARDVDPCRGFRSAIVHDPDRLAVIAEFKRRSPSKGPLRLDADARSVVATYAAGGATALSILTEPTQFGGSLEDLRIARETALLPILRKDFIVDTPQILEARVAGADAILLIAAAFGRSNECADLAGFALELGLDVLIEVHDQTEAQAVRSIRGVVFGINARNLATFDEHLDEAFQLRSCFAVDDVVVAESAIRNVGDAQRACQAGFDAVLVGEMLMRADNPEQAVHELSNIHSSHATHGNRR
ncbi:MAG: indole-3-glycerol phosphate synthase TrpC [Acidimicrobiia bacterium]